MLDWQASDDKSTLAKPENVVTVGNITKAEENHDSNKIWGDQLHKDVVAPTTGFSKIHPLRQSKYFWIIVRSIVNCIAPKLMSLDTSS